MNDDQSFVHNIKQTLDSSVDQLDVDISRRLRLARAKAVESHSAKHSYWRPVGGFALAATLVAAIGVWQFAGHAPSPGVAAVPQAMDDFEMIAAADSLQLYENLEFYQWLEVIKGDAG